MVAGEAAFAAEEGQRSFTMTRVFDAPRDLVFEASTKCEHLKHWWGPRGYELTVCEVDLRPGGSFRYVQRAPDGSEHPFKGEYLEFEPPERVVHTFIYDVDFIRDHGAVVTVTLSEQDGKTKLTSTTEFQSVEDRDAALGMGMEKGALESLDRLDELLADLKT